MKKAYLLIFVLAAAMLAACGGGDTFRVIGTVDGLGTQNIRIVYYSDQAVKSATTTVIDGKFNFEGRAAQPVIMELYTNTRSPIGRLVVRNGETVEARFSLGKPTEVSLKGNDTSEELAKFIKENKNILDSGNSGDVNEAITRYVTSHTGNFLSTVLLLTYYDCSLDGVMADSLMSMIDVGMRPASLVEGYYALLEHQRATVLSAPVVPLSLYSRADSMMMVNPMRSAKTLLGFTLSESGMRDSIVPRLNDLVADCDSLGLQIVEISLDTDTAAWKKSIDDVKTGYDYTWVPGAVAATGIRQLSVPGAPFFIVADSTGAQLYRGESIAAAVSAARSKSHR